MTHETAGDPVSGLKWTHRTTAKLAHELRGLGIHVCPQTVARLLKAMGYSLRVNHKKLAGASHPNRDQQFRYITELRERCAADNLPVISVDTKKKELVGAFRNPGAKWDAAPNSSTTTTSPPMPMASPSPTASTTRAPMPAPSSSAEPPTPRRSPSTASRSGGAPRAASTIRKPRACRSSPTAAAATVPRRAPGSSTCNIASATATACASPWPITRPPRRSGTPSNTACSAKSARTGRAAPLDSYETILNYLRTTRTSTGLRVRAHLVRKTYKTGVKVTDAQMRELRITPNRVMPKWNYTIEPI